MAVDDRCHGCFTLWTDCFGHMEWPEMIRRHSSETEFQALVTKARSVREGLSERPKHQEAVQQHTLHSVKVKRQFVVLTEKEMRRHASLARIPKMALKKVPKVLLPGDGGQLEEMYCFLDTDNPFRKLEVESAIQCQQSKDIMAANQFAWTGQSKCCFSAAVPKESSSNGVAELLEKEVYLHSWDDFMRSKLMKEEAEAEDGAEANEQTTDQEDAGLEEELSGAAAGVAEPLQHAVMESDSWPARKTPTKGKPRSAGPEGVGGLQRMRSQSSLDTPSTARKGDQDSGAHGDANSSTALGDGEEAEGRLMSCHDLGALPYVLVLGQQICEVC